MIILIVSDSYPPEIRSASHLMQELAEELRDRGHAVTVATCYPKYNLSESAVTGKYQESSLENGIRVIRIRTLPHHKVNFVVRGISQLTLSYVFRLKLKRYLTDRRVDAVLVYSPPLPLWKIGLWIKRSHGARFVLNIQDIFPQNAIDLGALRNSLLIRFFEKMEKRAYDHADVVTVHSHSNGEFLVRQKKIAHEKLVTLHNWVEIGPCDMSYAPNVYRKGLGLENKFVFFFGGVLGPSQGLDLILDAAKKIQDIPEAVILLLGDGIEKERLEQRAQDEGLTNVVFHPFLSKEAYKELLMEVDVGLVSLTIKNKTPVVPGKVLGYMGAGVPVLAFLNRESDGHLIIQDAKCGYSEVSDGVEKAANLMRKMVREKDSLRELGLNGHQYALQNFSKKVCVDKLERSLC